MAAVIIECPIDPETLLSIRELRELRLEILKSQLSDIDYVMNRLLIQGAIPFGEEDAYREAVLADLSSQCRLMESRIEATETVYSDELELYYEIMSEAQ
ncbi:MAG: hypothetical protein EOP10_12875 [Proteobacteria bacterium]|nr:MAG: hypothetical protein EOP10_12875 [Pseudomonadota bacterium]